MSPFQLHTFVFSISKFSVLRVQCAATCTWSHYIPFCVLHFGYITQIEALLNSKKFLIVKYSRLYIYDIFFVIFVVFLDFLFCFSLHSVFVTHDDDVKEHDENEPKAKKPKMRQQYIISGSVNDIPFEKPLANVLPTRTHMVHILDVLATRNTCKVFRFNILGWLFFSSFSYSVFLQCA